jgi:hypothetical protein
MEGWAQGIDVSRYQGSVNWVAVRSSGVLFAAARWRSLSRSASCAWWRATICYWTLLQIRSTRGCLPL